MNIGNIAGIIVSFCILTVLVLAFRQMWKSIKHVDETRKKLLEECKKLFAEDTSIMDPEELKSWELRAELIIVKLRLIEFIDKKKG